MGRGLFLSSIGLIGSDDRVTEAIIQAGYFWHLAIIKA